MHQVGESSSGKWPLVSEGNSEHVRDAGSLVSFPVLGDPASGGTASDVVEAIHEPGNHGHG